MAINDNPSVKEALEAFVTLQRIKAILSEQTNPSVKTPKTGTGKRPMSEKQRLAIKAGREKYLERKRLEAQQSVAAPPASPPKSPPMPQNTVTKEANKLKPSPQPQTVKK